MRERGIVHPGLLERLQVAFPKTCTIYEQGPTLDEYGDPVVDEYGDPVTSTPTVVSGMSDIPCHIAPFRQGSQTGEQEMAWGSFVSNPHSIVLNGYYDITEQMIPRVDGQDYDIRRVEYDSEDTITVLRVDLVT